MIPFIDDLSKLIHPTSLPLHLLDNLSKVLYPASIADYVALSILFLAGATYLSRGFLWDKPDPYYHLAFERPQLKHGSGLNSVARETRNIAQKLAESNKNIVVFWGSQSGTAEGFANRLTRDISLRFGSQGALSADLSDFDPSSIAQLPPSTIAIFILSTYGEGDPSDNTAEFWDWMTKANKGETVIDLPNLRYFAFGLGNTNYKFYNRVVDVVVDALNSLGATALLPVARANDAEGTTQEDFIAWRDSLFTLFRTTLGLQESDLHYLPTIAVQEDTSLEPIDLHHGEPDLHVNANRPGYSAVRPLRLIASRPLFHRSSPRHCLHLDLDLSSQPEFTYKTGDHLAIWPSNPDDEVSRLLSLLGLLSSSSTPITIHSIDPSTTKIKIPSPTTPLALLRHYLEICAPLNRDSLHALAQFAPTPSAKHTLHHLATSKSAYASFTSHNHITLARLMLLVCPDQPTWPALPLSYLIESLPPLQPRYYSISSSSVLSPRKLSITVLVASSPIPNSPAQTIEGVVSNYLLAAGESVSPSPSPLPAASASASAHHRPKTKVQYTLSGPGGSLSPSPQTQLLYAHLRKSKFKLPRVSTCPLIMVCAGTGFAPFRAFLAERRQLLQIGREVGEMLLFFGCRTAEEDYIYQEEVEDVQAVLGDRLRVVMAFSREDAMPRRYVQDRIGETGDAVVRLLEEEGANLYICGRAAMAREVEKAVGVEMQRVKGWSEEQVGEWRKGIKRRNKWQEDVWG
ncbi:hypothetical protein FE257_011966 [Aspergillus nanangensis]|uniref:NADPH--hemoprotein reductase n=1 Tax=Aspergillus nanangensis TaxID=2582783 RepID=A0AAD4CGL4_ASPNN|nr:hypothetical protein FE257_011966 [Aspergillus nanangensis]